MSAAPLVSLSREDFQALIAPMSARYKLAMGLMYWCGLRVSEVVKLKWGDVSERAGTIEVRRSKNLVSRTVLLHRELRPLLDAVRSGRRVGRGESLIGAQGTGYVYAVLKRNATRVGNPSLHPHTLRHAFATRCVDENIPLTDVQALLGHASLATTQRYIHPSIDKIRSRFKEKGWI